MAESLTVTMSNPYGNCEAGPNKIVLTWVSAADGSVTQNICAVFAAAQRALGIMMVQPSKLMGFIYKVDTNPGATAPTDQYDITLTNADGVDVMAGALANRATATTEQVIPSDPPYVDSELSLNITNAGDTKGGTVTIYMANKS